MILKIRYDLAGNIECAGDSSQVTGDHTAEVEVPEDFLETFALGKYTYESGSLVENLSFVMPTPPELP